MKLDFDSKLGYQLDAIKSVIDLFGGLPEKSSGFDIDFDNPDDTAMFDVMGVGNNLTLPEGVLLQNLLAIQSRNNILRSRKLIEEHYAYQNFPNFSVEMETGTGKTYVYLRTIFELNQEYGFKKFIIVVPSVAIREGTTSSIQLMRDHFKKLYENVPFDSFVYHSKNLNQVQQFALNNEIQIMIINIQAFQRDVGDGVEYATLSDEERKKLNIIHQERDGMSGHRPIEFIQATRPIVIIDEPQSVDNTPKSQRAISSLNPLFCLRYSATHTNPYNLVYQLDPIKAYEMELVKKIEVVDASEAEDANQALIRLDSVFYPKNSNTPQAKVSVFVDKAGSSRVQQKTVRSGTDLEAVTNRPDYEGYRVTTISAEPGNEYIEFQNGIIVELHTEIGGSSDERMRSQIEQTVEAHFAKEKKLQGKGIKVLSLFFIDHVKSYRTYDDSGNPGKGKLAEWFEESYKRISEKSIYKGLLSFKAEEVHDGYFAADKRGGRVQFVDTSGVTLKDAEVYELIMKDKVRLLNQEVPLRFIFSHSALREGWDNPNVFQICTLREMGTDRERRQTIGRGLRLPVNNLGKRVFDTDINRLTVIANETFEDFAKGLQEDIEKAIDPNGGFKFGRLPKLAFTPLLNPAGTDYLTQDESISLWEAIKEQGCIDKKGDFTPDFEPTKVDFTLNLGDDFKSIEEHVLQRMMKFMPRDFVKNARTRRLVSYNKRVELNADFKELWDKIKQKTKYSVEFKTHELIEAAVKEVKRMQPTQAVRIEITKRDLEMNVAGIDGSKVKSNATFIMSNNQPLPDILSFLQRETELTRGTLVEILARSGRLSEFSTNPQAFMSEVARVINRTLRGLIVDGIKYEPVPGQYYEMCLFKMHEVEEYLSRLYEVKNKDRTPFNFIPYDSGVEEEVAQLLDKEEKVKFFCKLPRWFKVDTPLGGYTPDWAVVVEDEEKLYLVRETKSTLDPTKRRESENKKAACGKKHFESIGMNFKEAAGIYDVLSK